MNEHTIQYGETLVCDGGDYTIELPNGDFMRLTAVTGALTVEQDPWEKEIAQYFKSAAEAGERIAELFANLFIGGESEQA